MLSSVDGSPLRLFRGRPLSTIIHNQSQFDEQPDEHIVAPAADPVPRLTPLSLLKTLCCSTSPISHHDTTASLPLLAAGKALLHGCTRRQPPAWFGLAAAVYRAWCHLLGPQRVHQRGSSVHSMSLPRMDLRSGRGYRRRPVVHVASAPPSSRRALHGALL